MKIQYKDVEYDVLVDDKGNSLHPLGHIISIDKGFGSVFLGVSLDNLMPGAVIKE